MSLHDICCYLNSLPDKIDELSSSDTIPFFASPFGPQQIDTPLDTHFDNFVKTIKSLTSWVDASGIHLSMQRVFTEKESLSMKASQNVEAFVWALGYKTFGCGLDISHCDGDEDLKTRKEALYFLQSVFQQTQPNVRTLQSLSHAEAHKEEKYREYMNYVTSDNSSFTNREKLTKTCCSIASPDSFFYNKNVEHIDGMYNGPSEKNVSSFIFTSSLKFLEDNTKLYGSSTALNVQEGVVIRHHLQKTHTNLYKLLEEVFSDLEKKSARLSKSICSFKNYIGIKFSRHLNCDWNKELLCDFHLTVLQLKGKKYLKYCSCRECIELDAGYQACLLFVDRAVLQFQAANQIQI